MEANKQMYHCFHSSKACLVFVSPSNCLRLQCDQTPVSSANYDFGGSPHKTSRSRRSPAGQPYQIFYTASIVQPRLLRSLATITHRGVAYKIQHYFNRTSSAGRITRQRNTKASTNARWSGNSHGFQERSRAERGQRMLDVQEEVRG